MFTRQARLLSMFLLPLVGAPAFAQPIPIPLKPDPPFTIDADLSDWRTVPNLQTIDSAAQAVYGASAWSGPADCSATVQLAWREDTLYLAATVRDDQFRQPQQGRELWRGDCLMLFLDTRPADHPGRPRFGEGQFQIGLTPGSLTEDGVKAEAFCYAPDGQPLPASLVASAKTADGYILEVSLPWAALGAGKPTQNQWMAVEFGLSDSDVDGTQQETMLTLGTAPWEIMRPRLLPAVIAAADGQHSATEPGTAVLATLTLQRDGKETVSFEAPAVPAGQEAVLRFNARLEYPQVAGYSPSLNLQLNGTVLEGDRLLNKPIRAKARSGDLYSMAGTGRFSVFYAPDYTSPDNDPHYGLLDGIRPALFELRVTDLLREGANTLDLAHQGQIPEALVVGDAEIVFMSTLPAAAQKAPAPVGPQPRITPQAPRNGGFFANMEPDATIVINDGDSVYRFQSRFSTPDGAWVHGDNPHFTFARRVEHKPEAIHIYDTFTNRTGQPLPLMHRHELQTQAPPQQLWLAGLDQPAKAGKVISPSNPTLCARLTNDTGIGLLPLDDVFRIHGEVFSAGNTLGLNDSQLVLAPGAAYTAEWAILPLAGAPDYWTFINAARRLIGANITIDGGFAFLRNGPLVEAWSDQQVNDFIQFKDPKYVSATIAGPFYNDTYPHGTAFQRIDHESYRAAFTRWRRLQPARNYQIYFHCFIDVVEDGPQTFADARMLLPGGNQADYGDPVNKLYLPLETNSFGPAVKKNVDVILNDIKADGVYWDEHEYSRQLYHYGEPWDGFSGDIDGDTMKLRNLKSSVTLLTESWRLALAKEIMAKGSLIGNGPPFTRAMAALKFPCFVETGSISHCAQSHLHTPIALGDHLTEQSEFDAYRTMLAALDFGCVYHWYNDMTVIPTHQHLTSYMFPMTPLELRAGYVIGEERIITKVSGRYGWGDASGHELHLFDDTGREVEATPEVAAQIEEEGQRFTELRLAEDWSAAIVRTVQR